MATVLQIIFNTTGQEQSELLMAELSDHDFYAFETDENILKGYIDQKHFIENDLITITEKYQLGYEKIIIEEKNWNEQWERDFQPIIIGDFAAIRADFHQPIEGVTYDIIITPKMSFGTGHHPTTFLMVKAMQQLELKDKTVLDFGTGTGVLAILAAFCGSKVVAVDYDSWSITNTVENTGRNNCTSIEVIQSDVPPNKKKFEVILANINTHVLLNNTSALHKICNLNGYLLISGFLLKDVDQIKESFTMAGFMHVNTLEKDGWYCLLFKNERI